jgi:very-short-patch-repair endonuclease
MKTIANTDKLIKIWDSQKNIDLDPKKISIYNKKNKFWWICQYNHSFQSTAITRFNSKNCPVCVNQKVIKGLNDLKTTNPELAKEWNYNKNLEIDINQITKGSNKKVWWICEKGHESKASISSRSNGSNCPYCSNKYVLQGFNDLKTKNPIIAKEWNYEKNLSININYFGEGSSKKVWWICEKGHEWKTTIVSRKNGSGCPECSAGIKVSLPEKIVYFYLKKAFPDTLNNVKNDKLSFLNSKEIDIYIPSLKVAIEYDGRQHIIKRDIEKNNLLIENGIFLIRIRESEAEKLNDNRIKIFNLKSRKQEELIIIIKELLKFLMLKFSLKIDLIIDLKNDLIHIYDLTKNITAKENFYSKKSYLIKEWDYEKNGKIKPEFVSVKSPRTYWWLCEKGHSYQSKVYARTNGHNCPFCSGRKTITGLNDLSTVNNILSKEWNFDKNKGIDPKLLKAYSNVKVWWLCEKGHEWEATINNRAKGKNCPYCSGRKAITGYNDLYTLNIELAKQWNYAKNNDLKPQNIKLNSGLYVWWVCDKGHEWKARPAERSKGLGCPFCSGQRVLAGFNDLKTTNSEMAIFWNYEKNDIKITEISKGSNKKIWWICDKGHEWLTSPNNQKNKGCKKCSSISLIKKKE